MDDSIVSCTRKFIVVLFFEACCVLYVRSWELHGTEWVGRPRCDVLFDSFVYFVWRWRTVSLGRVRTSDLLCLPTGASDLFCLRRNSISNRVKLLPGGELFSWSCTPSKVSIPSCYGFRQNAPSRVGRSVREHTEKDLEFV